MRAPRAAPPRDVKAVGGHPAAGPGPGKVAKPSGAVQVGWSKSQKAIHEIDFPTSPRTKPGPFSSLSIGFA